MPTLGSNPATAVISKPLDTVRSLFDRADQPVNDRLNDWGVERCFRDLMSQPSFRTKVCFGTLLVLALLPKTNTF